MCNLKIFLGWTGEDCGIPDCGDGACYIDEGRGFCDGSTVIPKCVCNTDDVSYKLHILVLKQRKEFHSQFKRCLHIPNITVEVFWLVGFLWKEVTK